jgi:uncharacterized cupredoxin-like copper-binding protein
MGRRRTAVKHLVMLAGIAVVAILAVSGALYFSAPARSASSSVTWTTVSLSLASGPDSENVFDDFSPQNFTVTEGQHITLVFRNTDDTPHELAIPALNLATGVVPGGQVVRIVFVPDRVGTFGFGQPSGMCDLNVPKGTVCTDLMNGNVTVLAP